jgi:SAM-dependent methyltransferase
MTISFRIKSNATAFALRAFGDRFVGAFSIYLDQSPANDYGQPVDTFTTAVGLEVPIYEDYRYRVKAGWRYFRSLEMMGELQRGGQLTVSESDFLRHAIGTRTITVSPNEAAVAAKSVAVRLPELFIPESMDDPECPVLRPTESHLRKLVAFYAERHAAMLQQLAAANVVSLPAGAAILEIGFTTGGHSTFAFERLGLKASAVDNHYGGLVGESALHEYNKRLLSSNVEFRVGDITRTTSFPSGSFDVIFSASVLEHVLDLKAAFAEMYRLLKPGGAIIHNYSSYFCHDGGHALGVGDSPWAHVRMGIPEFLHYIEEFRPHEAEAARDWFQNALHQDMPQWKVQRLVAASGFRLAFWMAKPSAKRWLRDLTPDILRDCFAATPEIGIEDLVSRSVSFVGIKP